MKKQLCLPVILTGLPLLSSCSITNQKEAKSLKPNIIFILTDDMGYGDVGVYGGDFVPTPCIDKMAAEGIRFEQYYSASPISSPSRAGLLTGMHPARWNINSYLQTRKGNSEAEMADFLDVNAPTLPRAMKDGGYKTGHFGKWHLGGGRDVDNAPGFTAYGYDEYASTYESPDPDPLLTSTNWIWAKTDSIKRWNRTAYFVDKTLDFLKRNSGEPCFVNLWPDDMHTPWVGNIEEETLVPKGTESEKNFKTVLKEYDKQIGRLLQGIKDLNLDRNTIVIFTSDNGPAPSFRGSRAGNMRGCKASLFEGGTRMPFIIQDTKGLIPTGKVDSTSVVSALDMFQSLCALAGVKLPVNYKNQTDGTNMSKALLGKPQERKKEIYWEYRRNNKGAFPKPGAPENVSPNVAVRKGDWKLLINKDESDLMLYNLRENPQENVEVSAKYPQITKELKEKALTWRNSLPQLISSFK
ncbi:sulfatase [Bacteroides sp. 224]|uniref:sulfatase family protein n=1 Tax=Bacteroides sp. 224 TaxID=2302936 RepID=UPI0013D06B1F|nr:sulfatase-like hydrolase/transferase [Bacteroides sp. 224]NDV67120.1 N-acetylgalactosamine-6-sulfatase [Bacteroides sp. 224]